MSPINYHVSALDLELLLAPGLYRVTAPHCTQSLRWVKCKH